jgi:hypothetical protein
MFCTNCGAQNEDQAKFCTTCGKPLQLSAVPSVNNQQQAESPAVTQFSSQQSDRRGGGEAKVGGGGRGRGRGRWDCGGQLNYSIFGDNMPAVSIRLNAGESIYTQSGV